MVESPFIVRSGSSSTVRIANDEESIELVVISMPGNSFKESSEDRHSSMRDLDSFLKVGVPGWLGVRSGDEIRAGLLIEADKDDVIVERSGDEFLAGVMTLPPPNKDAILVAVFGARGGVFGNGYSSSEACSDLHRVNRLISA